MFRVAVVQMVSTDRVADNLNSVSYALREAHSAGCTLAVLPENFAFMGQGDGDKLAVAEEFGKGSIQTFLTEQVRLRELWLVAGTLPIRSKNTNKVYARSLVYNPQGKVAAVYDKMHLFDVHISEIESYAESQSTAAGEAISLADIEGYKLGLSVCYDLRFPELYRRLTQSGARMFSVPSAFTKATGLKHWEILLRARAIENQAFILAANQGGQHPGGRKTYGHSMIVEPDGNILAQASLGEDIVVADLDFAAQNHLRQRFPCLDHRVLM